MIWNRRRHQLDLAPVLPVHLDARQPEFVLILVHDTGAAGIDEDGVQPDRFRPAFEHHLNAVRHSGQSWVQQATIDGLGGDRLTSLFKTFDFFFGQRLAFLLQVERPLGTVCTAGHRR